MKISEILHLAADKYLAHNLASKRDYTSWYSCNAVSIACLYEHADFQDYLLLESRILMGLKEMGCDVSSSTAFKTLGYPDEDLQEETQGARYMWLKFAALMAEEQGV